MTLTDRIAKKLYELNEIRACGRVRTAWEQVRVWDQVRWKIEAREVLGEMREPTESMIEAAVEADIPGGRWGEATFRESSIDENDVPTIWQAMIDAALAEGGRR